MAARMRRQSGGVDAPPSRRQLAGGMSAPSPMVARALQDLSQGLEAFNSAMKMKEAPVPSRNARSTRSSSSTNSDAHERASSTNRP